jgi:tRNA (mo5U34)-methyltransferase
LENLREQVAALRWYHTIDLGGGVITPGLYDTPGECRRIPLPESLGGKRCLDIGTGDGFWAFEMERRGAAEVVALDIDDPGDYDWPARADEDEAERFRRDHPNHRRAFELAHSALGSRAERVAGRVYALDPGTHGSFDFVFMGSLLLHLRDPVGALMAVRRVVRGELLSVDSISPLLTLLHPRQPVARLEAPGWPLWWVMNLAAYRRLFEAAGFDQIDAGRPFRVAANRGHEPKPRSRRPLYGVFQKATARRGIPHAWVLAR